MSLFLLTKNLIRVKVGIATNAARIAQEEHQQLAHSGNMTGAQGEQALGARLSKGLRYLQFGCLASGWPWQLKIA